MYYSSNSFPQLTSSTHSHGHANVFPPSFFPHHTSHEIFLHPNNILQDPSFNNTFPANISSDSSPFIFENVSNLVGSTSNAATLLGEDHTHSDPLGYSTNKKTRSKKDRHSLIFTAQGLRHRRVRLSIDIAHKFFNLQDMLGFDKASQTLDWLFTSSKTAIQHLMEFRNYPNSSSTTSECDEGMLNSKIQEAHGNEEKVRSLGVDHFIAKESRERARARARERTRKKQWIRKLDEDFKKQISHNYRNLISSNNSNRSSGENATPFLPFSGISVNETPWKDIIVEATLNKRPFNSSPIYEYQKNLPVAEEIKLQNQTWLARNQKPGNVEYVSLMDQELQRDDNMELKSEVWER